MLRLLNLGLVIKIENKDMYSNNDISKVIKQHFPFVTDKQLEQFELASVCININYIILNLQKYIFSNEIESLRR